MNTFEDCVAAQGTIKTKSLSNNRYQRVCVSGIHMFFDVVKEKGKGKDRTLKKE